MKILFKIFLFILFFSIKSNAQWPGTFYAFELKGTDGKYVDSLSSDYKLTVDNETSVGPAGIDICKDNKTWRFYKGDKNLYISNSLIIEKISDGNVEERMILKFPPPLTRGKEKFYSNLYIGEVKFKEGTYKIKLPKTPDEWDALKEFELCPELNNYNMYFDISKYQNLK